MEEIIRIMADNYGMLICQINQGRILCAAKFALHRAVYHLIAAMWKETDPTSFFKKASRRGWRGNIGERSQWGGDGEEGAGGDGTAGADEFVGRAGEGEYL